MSFFFYLFKKTNAIAQRKKGDSLQLLTQIGQQVVTIERQLTDLLNSIENEKDELKTHENLLQHTQQQEQRQKDEYKVQKELFLSDAIHLIL